MEYVGPNRLPNETQSTVPAGVLTDIRIPEASELVFVSGVLTLADSDRR